MDAMTQALRKRRAGLGVSISVGGKPVAEIEVDQKGSDRAPGPMQNLTDEPGQEKEDENPDTAGLESPDGEDMAEHADLQPEEDDDAVQMPIPEIPQGKPKSLWERAAQMRSKKLPKGREGV